MTVLRFIYSALPFAFFIFLEFGFNSPYVAVLSLLACGIHEAGHEAAIILIGRKFAMPRPRFYGMRINMRFTSYKEELAVYSAGPLANFTTGGVSYLLSLYLGEYLAVFGTLNILGGISNLLIIRGYDGYGILSSILYMYLTEETAERITCCLSVITLIAGVLLSLYLMYFLGAGFFVYCIFVFSLFSELESLRRRFLRICEKNGGKTSKSKFF